jgi:hypothetical protein
MRAYSLIKKTEIIGDGGMLETSLQEPSRRFVKKVKNDLKERQFCDKVNKRLVYSL